MKRVTLYLVLASVCLSPASLAAREGVRAESATHLVTLVRTGKPTLPHHAPVFTFKIVNKRPYRVTSFKLYNRTTEIRELKIVNNNLVVFGNAGHTADVVTIMPLQKPSDAEYFLCYGPQLSPTGRFIIYKRFYPRFSQPPATSDVLIVYDLKTQSNQELLEPGNPKHLPGDPKGVIIFPETNVKVQSLRVWVEDAKERNAVVSSAGYLWLNNDTHVLFVDVFRGNHWIVSVSLSDVAHPQVRLRSFDLPDALTVSGLARTSGGVLVKLEPTGKTLSVTLP